MCYKHCYWCWNYSSEQQQQQKIPDLMHLTLYQAEIEGACSKIITYDETLRKKVG